MLCWTYSRTYTYLHTKAAQASSWDSGWNSSLGLSLSLSLGDAASASGSGSGGSGGGAALAAKGYNRKNLRARPAGGKGRVSERGGAEVCGKRRASPRRPPLLERCWRRLEGNGGRKERRGAKARAREKKRRGWFCSSYTAYSYRLISHRQRARRSTRAQRQCLMAGSSWS